MTPQRVGAERPPMVPPKHAGFRNRPLPTFGAASRIQGRCFLMATEWHGRAELVARNGKLAPGMWERSGADPASIERKVPAHCNAGAECRTHWANFPTGREDHRGTPVTSVTIAGRCMFPACERGQQPLGLHSCDQRGYNVYR